MCRSRRESSRGRSDSSSPSTDIFRNSTSDQTRASASQQQRSRRNEGRASAACLACRRRKTKCSGGPAPCKACLNHHSECFIDQESDKRRRLPKSVTDKLDIHAPALNRLVDSLRGSDSDSDRVLNAIRSNAPLSNILALVEGQGIRNADKASPQSDSIHPLETEYSFRYLAPTSGPKTTRIGHFQRQGGSQRMRLRQTDPRRVPEKVDSSLAPWSSKGGGLRTGLDGSQRPNSATRGTVQHERSNWHPRLCLPDDEHQAESEDTISDWPHPMPDNSENGTAMMQKYGSRDRSQQYPDAGYNSNFGNLPISRAILANGGPCEVQKHQLSTLLNYEYHILPLNHARNTLLGSIVSNFRTAATKMISDGIPVREVFGPEDPNLDLLLRDRIMSDAYSISNWASELCCKFPAYNFPELARAAVLFTYYMRWLVLPTPENYAAMPKCARPTQTQRLIPHCPSVDLQPLPALRDALCHDFRDFQTVLEQTISVNWPYSDEQCVEVNPATGLTHMTQHFRAHIMNVENLSFGSAVLTVFPELKDRLNIRERIAQQ